MKSVFEYISEWCGKDNVKKYLANIIIQRQEKNLDDIIVELNCVYPQSQQTIA